MASRITPRGAQRRVMAELLDVAAARGRDLLGWDLGDRRKAALIELGASRLASYPMRARLFSGLFRKVQPRLAIVEEGCYGHMAVLNSVARDHGVRVAEFQHGMVTRGHDAYNVAPMLAGSQAYNRTQPHAFLGYGDWWLDQFSAPVRERVAIGNPHRSRALGGWSARSDRRSIIVLGDGVETDAHIVFAARSRQHCPKLVPSRLSSAPARGSIGSGSVRSGVEIDRDTDLYASLASAQVVIAEASTALFEAVGLVPRVFAWDTPKSRFYLGAHPFERALDPADLTAKLSVPRPNDGPAGASIWADDWESRFGQYLERTLNPGTGVPEARTANATCRGRGLAPDTI